MRERYRVVNFAANVNADGEVGTARSKGLKLIKYDSNLCQSPPIDETSEQ